MAATNRLFVDFLSGTIDADPGSGGTTLSGDFLADLPAVADPDFVALILDPEAVDGDPEVVWVTAHTASATTATVERGKEGSTGRAHDSGTKVVAALTADAVEELEAATAAVQANTEAVQTNVDALPQGFLDSATGPNGTQDIASGTEDITDLDFTVDLDNRRVRVVLRAPSILDLAIGGIRGSVYIYKDGSSAGNMLFNTEAGNTGVHVIAYTTVNGETTFKGVIQHLSGGTIRLGGNSCQMFIEDIGAA